MKLCRARFKYPFRESEMSVVAFCKNVSDDRLTCLGKYLACSSSGENMIALRDERHEGDATEPRVVKKFRFVLHGCEVVALVLGEGERV